MKRRCLNPSCKEFPNYGARGITVCDEWMSFPEFAKWSISHGYSDELTIDRIDNDKGYSPDNCRWVDYKVQANNSRNSVHITIDGVTKTMKEWSEQSGVKYTTLKYRLEHGFVGKSLVERGDLRCKLHTAELKHLKDVHSGTKCDILTEYKH